VTTEADAVTEQRPASRIAVHHALFGERNRGHGLITHSGLPEPVLTALVGRTDVPSSLPPGTKWLPYLSGYAIGDTYVVSRTFPDPGATRSGMVLTHAVVLSLRDAIRITQLEAVVDLLPSVPNRDAHVERSAIEDANTAPLAAQAPRTESAPPPGLGALARALLTQGATLPVVWLGDAGFSEVVLALWRALWPQVRATFSFRMSFGPADVATSPPTVVTSPIELASRWGDYQVIGPAADPPVASLAEALLVGDSVGAALEALRVELGAELTRIADLVLLEHCYRYLRASTAVPSELGALVRLLGRLSPSPTAGTAAKAQPISLLAEKTATGKAIEIRALRNLDLSPFPDGASVVEAVKSWAYRHAVSASHVDPAAVDVVQLAFAPTGHSAGAANGVRTVGLADWATAVKAGVAEALTDSFDELSAQAVWTWWQPGDDRLVEAIGATLPFGAAAEQLLADSCPLKLDRGTGEAVARLSAARGWLELHATVVATCLSAEDAVRRQLAVDRSPTNVRGIERLSARLREEEVVSAGLSTGDARVVAQAGKAVAVKPTLLATFDATLAAWRDVWLAAIDAGMDPIAHLVDSDSAVRAVLDAALAGDAVPDRLLVALGTTRSGNILTYPKRAAVWSRFSGNARDTFLRTTADAWLTALRNAPTSEDDASVGILEPELKTAVLASRQTTKILTARDSGDTEFAIRLFKSFSELRETKLVEWLSALLASGERLEEATAQALGNLVSQRDWGNAAAHIAERVGMRPDFRPALPLIMPTLPRWRRIEMWIAGLLGSSSSLAEDEPWEALMDLGADLYPWGPGEHSVWERAGGDFASLVQMKTGRESWRAAIVLLRRGGGGSGITPAKLLRAMHSDFPKNSRISVLQQVPTFGRKR
jgi:hypothetical protein